MNKDIKDYLHLYLGCEVINPYDQVHTLTFDNYETLLVWGKPILRPLSDMTEDEEIEMSKRFDDGKGEYGLIKAEAFQTAYLLAKNFDLFGLIDSGLAIDKTKTK